MLELMTSGRAGGLISAPLEAASMELALKGPSNKAQGASPGTYPEFCKAL